MTRLTSVLLAAMPLTMLLPASSPAAEGDEKVVRLVWFPRFSPDGKWLLSAHGSWEQKEGGEVRMWNAENGEPKHVIKFSRGVRSVAWSPKGEFFVAGGYGGSLRFFDTETGKQMHEIKLGASVEGVRITEDGKRLVTTHGSGDVRVFELPSRKELYNFKGAHKGGIWGMSLSPSGKLAATAGKDGYVRILDLETFQKVHELKHPTETNGVVFTKDNKTLLTGCADAVIRVFDVGTGEEQAQAKGHERGSVTDMQFASDGKLLASAGIDGTIRLWDVSSLKKPLLKKTIQAHEGLGFGAAISPDDEWIASAGWDDKVTVWELKTGDERWSWKRLAARPGKSP